MDLNENHIVIGLGGTGGSILRAFRKRIFQDFSEDEIRKMPIGYIYVDSSKEMMDPNDPTWKVLGKNAQLGVDSQLYIRGANLKQQLDNVDSYPGIRNWIGSKKIWSGIANSIADDGAAAQRRRLGRFLFSCEVSNFLDLVRGQITNIRDKIKRTDVTFHIFTGLAGGTGSGSIVDVIAQLRKNYRSDINSTLNYKIFTYCLIPEQNPKQGWDKGFYHANGFAALTELNSLVIENLKISDVSGEFDRIDLEGGGDFFNGCYLFTNSNENGVIVDTKEDLPRIVSDFLYHKIFVENGSEAKNQINRAESNENLGENINEYDENTTVTEEITSVRSKKFVSFGIKTLEIPETEIIEYFTYNFANQALLQFKYNNWSDDLGFRDRQRNEDYFSFVNDKNTLSKWLISDDHLTLSLPILKGDETQRWKTIIDDWNAIVPQLKAVAWQRSETTALNDLSIFCEERFAKNFRKHGVHEFYKMKRDAKKEIAQEICQKIERDLFDEWKNGQKSINDNSKIVDILINQTRVRLGNLDTKINDISEDVEKQIVNKKKNETIWSDTGPISTLFGKKKNLFEAQGVILQNLYTQKTNIEAWLFAKDLLAETLTQMEILSTNISSFTDKLNNAIENTIKLVATRCQDKTNNGNNNLEKAKIRYYDSNLVKDFTKRLIKDETIQRKQTSEVRTNIVSTVGNEPTFTKLNEEVTEEMIFNALETCGKENSVAAHDNLISVQKDKLIGVNIIDKLYEEFNNNQEELKKFARKLVNHSGTFINFNNGEVLKTIANNNAPRPGVNIKIENVVISIPKVDEKRDFVNKLKEAFKSSVSGNKTLIFDETGNKDNQITIMSITNGFPLRVVNELLFLRRKYDSTIQHNNADIAKLVLHLEGDGSQHPKIFLKTPDEKLAEEIEENKLFNKMAYYLIAIALDVIKLMDLEDRTGKKQYGIVQTDRFGRELSPYFFGSKLINAHGNIDDVLFEKMKTEVDLRLNNEFLHITKRKELFKKVTSILNSTIKSECRRNRNDPVYKDFFKASDFAIKLLEIEVD